MTMTYTYLAWRAWSAWSRGGARGLVEAVAVARGLAEAVARGLAEPVAVARGLALPLPLEYGIELAQRTGAPPSCTREPLQHHAPPLLHLHLFSLPDPPLHICHLVAVQVHLPSQNYQVLRQNLLLDSRPLAAAFTRSAAEPYEGAAFSGGGGSSASDARGRVHRVSCCCCSSEFPVSSLFN